MKKILLTLLCVSPLFSCRTQSDITVATPSDKGMDGNILSRCDSVMYKGIADGNYPGAVLCIVRDDAIVYKKAYGNKCIVPDVEPMTEDAVFDMASLSKCIGTTISFLQLVDKGLVSIEDRVDSYIPGFKNWEDPVTGECTPVQIKHLMTHTSGLASYPDARLLESRFGENCPDSLLDYLAKELPRYHKPGAGHIYSCPNFMTVQNILQRITGSRLCDYAEENVFKPLGLSNTMYLPTDESIPSRIYPLLVPTEVQGNGIPLRGAVHDPIARRFNMGNSGNAGVFSCAHDLAVIASMLLDGGVWKGRRILSEGSVRMLSSVPEEFKEFGRTIGWDASSGAAGFIGRLSGDRCICHTGYTGTSMVLDFDKRIAIIILSNRVHPKDDGSLAKTRTAISDIVAESLL